MKLDKATKKEFVNHALKNGLHFVGAPWNMSLEDVTSTIDEQGERVKQVVGSKRDKVSGNAKRLIRHGEKDSFLYMGKDDTVYNYKGFWLIRNEDSCGNNTIIYI